MQVAWHTKDLPAELTVTPCGRRVSGSSEPKWGGAAWRNAMSIGVTDDFAVSVTHDPTAASPGCVSVGFISPTVFARDTDVHLARGAYTLWLQDGMLYGSGRYRTAYCPGAAAARVRCIANRKDRTISFEVNGVDHGVAWTDVSPGPLHAVVVFAKPGHHVDVL